ncbi:MAG: hypothetical protein FWE63_04090 [Bacteroidales bacterium]|nr:hypothetical protein [Bacteroidales bacterium]
MKRTFLFIISVFFSLIAMAQFEGKVFRGKQGRIIYFTNSSNFNTEHRFFLDPIVGSGSYRIEKNRLIATFAPYQNKDTSSFQIKKSISSNTTDIYIECVYKSDCGRESSCELANWWIATSDSVLKQMRPFGIENNLTLSDLSIPQDARLYFGGIQISNLSIPLYPNTKTHYLVTLKRRVKYLEEGEMIFKIREKKGKTYLRLINGKKLVGYKTMDFILYDSPYPVGADVDVPRQ